jgi:hypothetical protein
MARADRFVTGQGLDERSFQRRKVRAHVHRRTAERLREADRGGETAVVRKALRPRAVVILNLFGVCAASKPKQLWMAIASIFLGLRRPDLV